MLSTGLWSNPRQLQLELFVFRIVVYKVNAAMGMSVNFKVDVRVEVRPGAQEFQK